MSEANSAGEHVDKDRISDVCVIGGGVNGAGIARDAVGRGLSVVLVEKDDLAQGTSSRSGKLVHGGLRYLEYYEFRLVREALIEREVLLESAPHIIWPMRFVLPHSKEDRPAWLVRAGLFLYDHLGGRRRLPATRVLDLGTDTEGAALKEHYTKAFEFSDCWVDDARLVVLNALDASERGAQIHTRTRCDAARRVDGIWELDVHDTRTGAQRQIKARSIVNAAGPWVNRILESTASVQSKRQVRLVKGSHIVVRKFWEGEQAYLIQNSDKRVIFINPYENGRALIGTTDIPFDGNADEVTVDDGEIDYLIAAVNRYFSSPLSRHDVLHAFSGVRPLFDDNAENPSAVTRDYLFDVDSVDSHAPILSVFGGKITTFRKLAEHVLDKLQPFFPHMSSPWTSGVPLPGGDMPNADFDGFYQRLIERHAALPDGLLLHYARHYGTRCDQLLKGVTGISDLGREFSPMCFEIELRHLIENEWALTSEDILQRRTKHALHMSPAQIADVEHWLNKSLNQRSETLPVYGNAS
ncbi:MAG: glycerol-3-phosphate dehydrogenase [Granulosicoccus sp.]